MQWCPEQESNLYLTLRRGLYYPLYDRDTVTTGRILHRPQQGATAYPGFSKNPRLHIRPVQKIQTGWLS